MGRLVRVVIVLSAIRRVRLVLGHRLSARRVPRICTFTSRSARFARMGIRVIRRLGNVMLLRVRVRLRRWFIFHLLLWRLFWCWWRLEGNVKIQSHKYSATSSHYGHF